VNWRATTRRLLPYFLAAAGGFLIAYLVVFLFVFPTAIVPNDGQVPNVVGLTYDDATRRLRDADFEARPGQQIFHASAPQGTVLRQHPAAGRAEARGTHVLLDVSAGQRRGEVPNVVGMTRQQAEVALQNAGFDIGEVVERPSVARRGAVIATAPAAATSLALPASVSIVLSGGVVTVDLPDLIGRPVDDARRALEQLGLTVTVQVDSSATAAPNTVVAQSPAARRAVPAGASVSLRVAARRQ
jgi:serine/threonine-protein kinase